jgi:cell division protein FtsN
MAKPAPAARGASRSIVSGILIGLVLGLLIAGGLALWFKDSKPFKTAEPSHPAAAPSRPVTQAPSPPPAAPEPAPSFDFYKVLPSNDAVPPPPTKPATPQAPRYYLQAGAFQNAAEADNLKAQLALIGVEAQIQTAEIPDKGVMHRVRVGPFPSLDALYATRLLLTQNNIPANLVKESP